MINLGIKGKLSSHFGLPLFLFSITFAIAFTNTFAKNPGFLVPFEEGNRPNPSQSLDHSLSLRPAVPYQLEADHHSIIVDGKRELHFAYPRPCLSSLDSSQVCNDPWHLRWAPSNGTQSFAFQFLAAEEWREIDRENGQILATEFGGQMIGRHGPLSFYLDTRTTSESWEGSPYSWDRQIVDFHSDTISGGLDYSSYSRYTGDISLDLPYGQLSAFREAAHWGPGLYGNLVFQQEGIPFHGYRFESHLGPFSITSLYGDLGTGSIAPGRDSKSVYAHRYEWRPTDNILFGISEEIILTHINKPYFFVPIFPLFVGKSFVDENSNNGNIAADLSYRLKGIGLVYSEFLVDDLESPSSFLTRNYRENKWGWLAGFHLAHNFSMGNFLPSNPITRFFSPKNASTLNPNNDIQTGLIAEYSRVEPWVYTHFTDWPSQASNLDQPLGNPLGPNNQRFTLKAYARAPFGLYTSFTIDGIWKGKDLGSNINDPYEQSLEFHTAPKAFIDGVSPDWTYKPSLAWTWNYAAARLDLEFGNEFRAISRVMLYY